MRGWTILFHIVLAIAHAHAVIASSQQPGK